MKGVPSNDKAFCLLHSLYSYVFKLSHEVKEMILITFPFELHLHRYNVVVARRSVFTFHLVGVDDNFFSTQTLQDKFDTFFLRRY